jgi:hypothetical protein
VPVTASEFFEFLKDRGVGTIDRHEITSAWFARLRRGVRRLALLLSDSQDVDTWERLRTLLSEWLTVPLPFEDMHAALVTTMGSPEAVTARWGREVGHIYAQTLSGDTPMQRSPMRECVCKLIVDLREQHRGFKIFCHARARPHFETLVLSAGNSPLEAGSFLHSVPQYRDAGLFDTLIKVGPLRAGGWGSAPDAVLTAPRFQHLAQVVWWGCSDEPGFGYDPAFAPRDELTAGIEDSHSPTLQWGTHHSRFGDALPPDASDLDELQVFKEMEHDRGLRPATLLQIGSGLGFFYPPHSQVLSFDPDPSEPTPVRYRVPGDTLLGGMYLVRPLVNDVDLGAVRAEYDSYSRTWKERLAQAAAADGFGLVLRLQKDGLDLENLYAAIRNWRKPPSTVIHAPKQRKHFVILMRALGLAGDDEGTARKTAPFWRQAWNEIRRSRGQAIQAGVHEHEIVDEQLQTILKRLMPEIRSKAAGEQRFVIAIPGGGDIQGEFEFSIVLNVQFGFRVPEPLLRTVLAPEAIEQWRA